MKVEINMINVEDGDAIILMLEKADKKALILIDGGYKKYYKSLRKRLKQILPDFNNRIDLVVCTHYDNDHLGGIERVLDDFHEIIQEVWIHKISESLENQVVSMKKQLKAMQEEFKVFSEARALTGIDDTEAIIGIRGYEDLIRVVGKIIKYKLEDKVKEPKRGDYLKNFEEFSVVSPTAQYYNSYLDELKDEKYTLLFEESISERVAVAEIYQNISKINQEEIENSCKQLEKSSVENSVSATNMVSIVTLLRANNKKYLFTGDAGIETFENQNILDDNLKNLDWLDLPHHGSKNNTSEKMLSHFNPAAVFVSGRGTPNRPHYRIKNCLYKKRTVNNLHITNIPNNTWYLKFNSAGEISRKFK